MISKDRVINNLSDLVGHRSVSGGETRIAGYVQRRHIVMGHDTHRIANNVVARIPGTDPTTVFVLGGHLDTLSDHGWQTDPYSLRQRGNRVVGLGVNDMKISLASNLEIGRELNIDPPHCDVVFIYAAKEETGGDGTVQVFNWLETQDWWLEKQRKNGLLGEPTYIGNKPYLCNGQRGGALLRVYAEGPTGHSGKNFRNNPIALQRVAKFIGDTPELQDQWQEAFADPELGLPTLNVIDDIHSNGGRGTTIGQSAVGIVDVRTTPALNRAWGEIRPQLEDKYRVSLRFAWWPNFNPVDRESTIWHAAKAVMRTTSTEAYPFGSDLSTYADHGVSTLLYGCGDREQIHQPGEEFNTNLVVPYLKTILNLIPAYAAA